MRLPAILPEGGPEISRGFSVCDGSCGGPSVGAVPVRSPRGMGRFPGKPPCEGEGWRQHFCGGEAAAEMFPNPPGRSNRPARL